MNSEPLDVGRMRLLREVGVRGTIAAAARELRLTPSAVSQQLAVLEREVGLPLVDRSPRGVTLTGAGRALAVRAGEVLDVLAAARADLDRLQGALGGPVGVAAVASAAVMLLCPAVRALAAAHPAIEVGVVVAEPVRALAALVAGDVDLAVVDDYDYVPLALPEFAVARPLRDEALVAVLPAGRDGRRAARGRGRAVSMAELADRAWVMPPADAACGSAVRSACRAAGFEPAVRWTSDDMMVLSAAVAAGHGVAVLPESSVVPQPGLAVVPLAAPGLHRRITAVSRAAALVRPAVTAVLDAVTQAVTDAVAAGDHRTPDGSAAAILAD